MTGKELKGNSVEGVLAIKQPWPSMARTIRGNHDRYMDSYFNVYKGYYVSSSKKRAWKFHSLSLFSSPVMGPTVTTTGTTGFEAG